MNPMKIFTCKKTFNKLMIENKNIYRLINIKNNFNIKTKF